ncbi:Hypothetical protein CINCED_3A005552 [Cinara cedri]|uniref:Uncharacterized protein n=1 Tax=Cinara cedri TaxID=506608 RepID=A0A5E4M2N1_9HEMI|nr:Hypothetical protein CINCED_3A005552 [Cinara cedri]
MSRMLRKYATEGKRFLTQALQINPGDAILYMHGLSIEDVSFGGFNFKPSHQPLDVPLEDLNFQPPTAYMLSKMSANTLPILLVPLLCAENNILLPRIVATKPKHFLVVKFTSSRFGPLWEYLVRIGDGERITDDGHFNTDPGRTRSPRITTYRPSPVTPWRPIEPIDKVFIQIDSGDHCTPSSPNPSAKPRYLLQAIGLKHAECPKDRKNVKRSGRLASVLRGIQLVCICGDTGAVQTLERPPAKRRERVSVDVPVDEEEFALKSTSRRPSSTGLRNVCRAETWTNLSSKELIDQLGYDMQSPYRLDICPTGFHRLCLGWVVSWRPVRVCRAKSPTKRLIKTTVSTGAAIPMTSKTTTLTKALSFSNAINPTILRSDPRPVFFGPCRKRTRNVRPSQHHHNYRPPVRVTFVLRQPNT